MQWQYQSVSAADRLQWRRVCTWIDLAVGERLTRAVIQHSRRGKEVNRWAGLANRCKRTAVRLIISFSETTSESCQRIKSQSAVRCHVIRNNYLTQHSRNSQSKWFSHLRALLSVVVVLYSKIAHHISESHTYWDNSDQFSALNTRCRGYLLLYGSCLPWYSSRLISGSQFHCLCGCFRPPACVLNLKWISSKTIPTEEGKVYNRVFSHVEKSAISIP